jgi:hypothetical protein
MILNVCDAQRKIEIPDYSRPRMEYVKVQFNCVDKSIYKSNNPRLKLFYEEVNNHLNVFLKLIKMNVMTIEEFQETSRNLRDEYISFQKNFTESALNCTNWLSYKNLNATVNSTIIILDFISNLNEQQYKGNFPAFQKLMEIEILTEISRIGKGKYDEMFEQAL